MLRKTRSPRRKKTNFSVWLDQADFECLQAEADRRGISKAQLFRQWLGQFQNQVGEQDFSA